MYASFYGFSAEPFHVTPDASLIYLSEGHREAIGALEYGLRAGKGFIVLVGEVGVGKTTVLRHCLRSLERDRNVVVYVLQPLLPPRQLLTLIHAELRDSGDAPSRTGDGGDLISRIYRQLLALQAAGKIVTIVIDEAQNVPVETLESLRLLSNLETDKRKFLQIVLVGQPELDEKLARHDLRQLDQRIAVRARIPPLTRAESLAYIAHRLRATAKTIIDPFEPAALRYIVDRAGGNPRRLNIFCDNALINGMGHRARQVTRRIAVGAIAPHLGKDRRAPRFARALSVAGFLGYAALGAAVGAAVAALVGLGIVGTNAGAAAAPQHLAIDRPASRASGAPPAPSAATAVPEISLPSDDKAAAPAASSEARSDTAHRPVQAGETLDSICQAAYGICTDAMVRALARLNGVSDTAPLTASRVLTLPVLENLKPTRS
jgi:type II secretory pathway predicted ATPase ExeA